MLEPVVYAHKMWSAVSLLLILNKKQSLGETLVLSLDSLKLGFESRICVSNCLSYFQHYGRLWQFLMRTFF